MSGIYFNPFDGKFITLPQKIGKTDSPTFAGMEITGDLTVSGNTVTVQDLEVSDKTITVAFGAPSGVEADGGGFIIDGANIEFLYKHAETAMALNSDFLPSIDSTFDIGSSDYQWADAWFSGNVSISGDISNLDTINFDTTFKNGPGTFTPGRLGWDDDTGTLNLGLDGNQTVLHIGQETLYLIKNQSGVQIDKGDVVMFAGAVGQSGRILGQKAIADGTFPAKTMMGIATENIPNGEDGYVTHFGKIRSINTTGQSGETWQNGDILYISPTVPGGLTNVQPLAPNLKISVAAVINAHANNGSIFVRPLLGVKIDELHNVNAETAIDNDILVFNNGVWAPSSTATLTAFNTSNGSITSNTVTTTSTSTTPTVIMSVNASEFRSGKLVLQAVSGGESHVTEVLVTHNGTNASFTEYGIVYTDEPLFDVTADIDGGNLRLLVTSASTETTEYRLMEKLFFI